MGISWSSKAPDNDIFLSFHHLGVRSDADVFWDAVSVAYTLLLQILSLQHLMTAIIDVAASKAELRPGLEAILMAASVHSRGLGIIFLLVRLAWGAQGWASGWALPALLCWDIHRLGSYLGPFFLVHLVILP